MLHVSCCTLVLLLIPWGRGNRNLSAASVLKEDWPLTAAEVYDNFRVTVEAFGEEPNTLVGCCDPPGPTEPCKPPNNESHKKVPCPI